ncbi:hypothetical protein [Natrialba sp. INN-245]|uniref:hypothetical protein n=1 Tax=Natrialba sp. INN-245 TaxID=2690967 RepID=UPI001313442C|nr:hypothetical protein [Natrialba sp. INN-245]MWV41057.1 hypothetical protein [Natrialba sp. INN-245]
MHSRTPQEDLLVVEVLVDFHYRRLEEQPNRACRAHDLARDLADQHGLTLEDALRQRDRLE